MVSGETAKAPAIREEDVLSLTPKGSAELSEARTSLSAQELEVLVLVDGHSTVAQIVRSARSKAREAVLETVAKPLESLNHFTVPVAMSNSIPCNYETNPSPVGGHDIQERELTATTGATCGGGEGTAHSLLESCGAQCTTFRPPS